MNSHKKGIQAMRSLQILIIMIKKKSRKNNRKMKILAS